MPQTKERRTKYKNITFEVPNSFFEEIESISKRKGISRSEFVRECIRDYVSSQK